MTMRLTFSNKYQNFSNAAVPAKFFYSALFFPSSSRFLLFRNVFIKCSPKFHLIRISSVLYLDLTLSCSYSILGIKRNKAGNAVSVSRGKEHAVCCIIFRVPKEESCSDY